MKSIENSDITLDQIITITERFEAEGSDGSTFWFVPYYQWVHCGTEVRELDCQGCKENAYGKSQVECYKICIDSVTYYVPIYAAAIEMMLRTEEQQNFDTFFQNKIVDQPKDYIETFKSLTGRTINTGEVEHNGYALWKTIPKNQPPSNTKIPGEP
jgi:hypothetical protein